MDIFSNEYLTMKSDGFPHSDIPGSTVVDTYPRLIAACRVLHRLSPPRHPPVAVASI